jgi:hypothetical protein
MAVAEFLKLEGSQVDEVVLIDQKNPYKSGPKADKKETYSRFRFEGTVFIVPDTNTFVQDFINGTVSSVKLEEGVIEVVNDKGVPQKDETGKVITRKSFAFDSHRSFAQDLNKAKHKATMTALTAANLSEVTLAALMQLA